MAKQLIVGLIAEGTTDIRFLKNVIFRSISEISWECDSEMDIYDIQIIPGIGEGFVENMTNALKKAYTYVNALCIHTDADSRTIENVMQNKFKPLYEAVLKTDDSSICKIIIPTIPVQMIEAWMLADTNLLRKLIDADKKTDKELSIDKMPEQYADPKSVINNAIRIAMSSHSKRRRDQITIDDLYESLGNQIRLDLLRQLPSFCAFEDNIRNAFRQLNLLH